MRFRTLSFPVLLALVLASATAAAQDITITIPDLPPGPATVRAGQTHSVSFTVEVVASGFQCLSEGTITLDLAVTNAGQAPNGVTVSIDPPNMTMNVPIGAHGLDPSGGAVPVGSAYTNSGTATLRVATTPAASGEFAASVSASYAGGPPMAAPPGCLGDLPAASGTASHQLAIQGTGDSGTNTTGPGTGTGGAGNNTGGNQTGPAEQPPPNRGLPGFEPLLAMGALAAAVALARRRRD